MAAEVPAKDVLCEAMEYLSKLGSNLRTRSENLKEKKIRREKLNNVLAVQKAANKVLLICELSKKSLDNVETGVRKVLELIDTSQASSSNGGKISQIEKDSKTKYYYFEYETRKLRIKNRVSFKHYNSVRVYAKMLPKSMIDKYPVHYDCKLYRMRRKKQSALQELQEETKKKKVEENSLQKDLSVISIPDTPISKPKAEKHEKKSEKNPNNDVSIISIPDSPEQEIDVGNKTTGKPSTKQHSRRKSSVESTKEKSASRDGDQSSIKKADNSETHRPRGKDHRRERKSSDSEDLKKSSKRKRIIRDSSSDAERNSVVDSGKKENNSTSKGDDSDVSGHELAKKPKLNEKSDDSNLSVDKNIAEKDTNEDDDTPNDSVKPMIKCVSLSKLLKPDVLEKKPVSGPHSKPKDGSNKAKQKEEELKKIEKQAIKEKEDEEYWRDKRKEVRSFQPKNFVINVTRLPDFSLDYLNKLSLKKITQGGITISEISDENLDAQLEQTHNLDGQKIDKDKNKTEELKKIKNKRIRSNESNSNSRQASSNSSDDDALIAEANKVKNSLLNESDSDDEIGSDNELKSSKKDSDNIKNALLNDSDSETKKSDDGSISDQDKADKEFVRATEQAKQALCNDSDSEHDENESKSTSTEGKTLPNTPSSDSEQNKTDSEVAAAEKKSDGSHNEKNYDNEDKNGNDSNGLVHKNDENLSECQKNEKTPEKEVDTDKAKSSLLNDSSDEKTKTPLSQRLTPQSKKKRMRESIHAKKMLLTYSSSDTEDDQLKKVLKDIKDSLLNGSDDENKDKIHLKESSPSSSSEDLKKVKKKMNFADSKPSREKRPKHKRKKHRRRLDSEDSSKNSDNSNLSSKMVRSKSKPGNSSSQNSDAPDSNDKDIDGLTNLNALNKPRRRNSNSSEMSESSATMDERKEKQKSSKSNNKRTGLIAEQMLEAESSSESEIASAEENDDGEDVQALTVPSINGGGEHLVKEDLLGDSDSSVSHNEDVTSVKGESGSEDKPNAKRRKAHAISSDSEVGSSRKKDADVKLSDFEDSDDSDINKRTKRKKKATDSDASVGTTSSNEGGKKKRRRIKSLRDSDVSGSDSENEGRNKHGRKNIRKVMGKNQLEEATKKAAREEKERIARIAERQKMYNNLEFDESGKPDEVVLDKVVLDFDPETKEPLIEVDRGLVKKLKPHQANGIKFMWDACFESVKRIKKDRGSGCILAHCMGLGKTLQVVSLTHTLLIHSDLTSVQRVLVVCPLSTVLNWVNEFRMWLKYAETEYEVEVYELSRFKQNSERAFQLSQWIRHGGVCVLGYEMFRNLSADNSKKFKKKMLKNFQEALVDPGPDLVVCDEGHLLKNEKTSLSQSMNRVRTHRRIVLTGTPLQNNLKEYYCMVQFVKPNLLGKYNEYLNRFVNPITNGQYTDSTEHDIKIMKRRSHVLHKMLDGAVQRRDYGVLAPFLPPKHEYVLFITLAEVQTKLYQHYLDNFSRKPLPGKSSGFLFPDFQSLQRIWTHPLVLKYNSERYEIMQQKKRDKEEEDSEGSIRDFIDDDSTSEESTVEELTDDSSEASDDSRKKSKKKKKSAKKSKGKEKDKEGKGDPGVSKPRRGTRANPIDLDEDESVEDITELKYENPTEWWIKLVTDDELDDMRNSHKLVLLFDILRQCETIGDKLLVFSQSLYSLDLIEHFLGKVDDATQEGRVDEKLGGHIGTWSPGIDYFRLDGSTSCENRSIWCKNFNREDNPRARLFLISTRAGGLGINLVAANRVVIFDVSWNPSHDVQSIFRVYRFGQKKPCYVYRFLAMGTMEEKIYERQVTKQAISKRVIDEQQIDRHYAENDLAELYNFEPKPPSPRPIPPLPKDRLFAEMLREHEVQIYKYHEHDSLLENKEEETLSEEERKAAWEDFENEKNRPPPAPFPNTWQMPNLLQQQQLAYAALAAMLRKDMPNLSDNQLRDMLPLIYNSNPQMFGGYDYGLMQKLSEIYKYSPGMMNPAMMNPGVMNPASGAGPLGALGGASGLQYEPPWQRQHQQQQQMRLQQLLQHQNQMGAKFYAGGLGSRDPVAMALQQQRAREIMLSNAPGAARPRGRPPLAPRAPPADVVNLDSD